MEVENAADIRAGLARMRAAAVGSSEENGLLLPPCFVAAVLSGGHATLGMSLDGTFLVPAVCVGTFGDVTVKKTRATADLTLPESFVLEALRGLVPRCAKSVDRIDDPELAKRLFALAVDQARALSAFAYAGDARWADSRNAADLEVLCAELLRISVQDLQLGSARAIDALKQGFTVPRDAGPQRFRLLGSQSLGGSDPRPTPLDRLELGALSGMMELPEETFFAGKTAARLAKDLAGERRAAAESLAAGDAEKTRLAMLRKTTPRDSDILVMYRTAGTAIESRWRMNNGPQLTEIRDGREWCAFRRDAFAADGCTVPSVVVEQMNHATMMSDAWTTCTDDESIAVTQGFIERSAQRLAPAYVLAAIVKGIAAAKVPTATSPKLFDLRQSETPRRVKLLRAHLERISLSMVQVGASSFAGETSGPWYITLALQLAVSRLSLSPLLVGAEVGEFAKKKGWPGVPSVPDLIARAADVAKRPATQLYTPLPEAKP